MSKRLLKGYLLVFLVLVLYLSIIGFFPKTAVFWIAAGFTVPVFFAQLFTLHTIDKQAVIRKDRALDFPRLRISILYLIVQFAASLLLMLFGSQIPIVAATAIEVIILLTAVAGFYTVEAACREIIRQDQQTRENMTVMQDMRARLHRLSLHCEQEQLQAGLHKLADEMRYCNPKSTDSSLEIETEMAALLTELEDVTLAGGADTAFLLCDRMMELLKERDRICKCKR